MNEWNIQSRAHACQACSRHFTDKQPYHTVLVDQRREIQRLDLCEGCWKEGHADGASSRQGFISHWQGVYEQPPAAPPEAIKKENAETLLRRIIESGDTRHAAASFILAVMLERKRILKVKEQFKRDGQRIFVYEQPRTGDVFTIADPDLQLNQLDAVQRDVADLLEHGLPEDRVPAPAGASPSSAVDAAPVSAAASSSGEAGAGAEAGASGESGPAEADSGRGGNADLGAEGDAVPAVVEQPVAGTP